MWTYGVSILRRLRNIGAAFHTPHYALNEVIQQGILQKSDKEAMHRFSVKYGERVLVYPNIFTTP